MWSPQTSEKQNTTDNKKKEELEDCRCSSEPAAAAVAAVSGSSSQQQQQQDNRKHQFSNINPSDKEEFGHEEAGDSGFISGRQQQQTGFYAGDEEEEGAIGGDTKELNTSLQQQQQHHPEQQQKQQLQEEHIVFDSGCIDEADFSDDDQSHEATAEASVVAQKSNEQQSKQVRNEHSDAAVAPAATTTTTTPPPLPPTTTDTASTFESMQLKANVDAGMPEWFCNLSLQDDPVPRPQLASSTSAIGMNNLGAASKKNINRQQQQPQQAAGNTATTLNVTPSTAWEEFYRQNDDGDTPLHLACIHGFVDIVAALIRMAPHPCLFNIQNDDAQTPLHLAALTAQPKILRMLLIAGAEPTIRDRHGNTALHLVCSAGEEQCVRALTMTISASEIHEAHRQYGHRSNDKTVSYLSYASLPSDLEIPNYDGERCVHLAAQAGHIEILRILVTHEADINAREGKSGRTPLHIAIDRCNEDLANFLLDECEKLNLEAATYAGLTAYQVACVQNKLQMQNILEKRGAELLTPPESDYDYDSSDIETDLDDSKYVRFGDPGFFVSYNGGNFMTVA